MFKKVIKSDSLIDDLKQILSKVEFDKLFILTDNNTQQLCLYTLNELKNTYDFSVYSIKSGDDNKNLDSLSDIWRFFIANGATRHSLLINLGGGMITDIGGFAAATFKRGFKCINIPTTLLGAVDAAVGGKTGINFEGLKNEIGVFSTPICVLIDSIFFKSLDRDNILSGYAEMLKHTLLANDKQWKQILDFDLDNIDYTQLRELTVNSVEIKEKIVSEDPFEKGIRKALNLGHTVGHAFESLSYKIGEPAPHGYAVAWGIVCELYLSQKYCGFPIDKLRYTTNFVKEYYTKFPFECKHYDELYELMKHDKKNHGEYINFTFLEDIGKIKLDKTAAKEDIFESIDFIRDSIRL